MDETDDVVDAGEARQRIDPEGHMQGLEHWSPLAAAQRARELVHILELDFVAEAWRRYVYELFPRGPISQGSRLAGVPPPPFPHDPSFGWAG